MDTLERIDKHHLHGRTQKRSSVHSDFDAEQICNRIPVTSSRNASFITNEIDKNINRLIMRIIM